VNELHGETVSEYVKYIIALTREVLINPQSLIPLLYLGDFVLLIQFRVLEFLIRSPLIRILK